MELIGCSGVGSGWQCFLGFLNQVIAERGERLGWIWNWERWRSVRVMGTW
jgi:hypothetical protein